MTITPADLKMLAREGAAKDISDAKITQEMYRNLRPLKKTYGANGQNGGLWISKSGKLYVVTRRTGAVYELP